VSDATEKHTTRQHEHPLLLLSFRQKVESPGLSKRRFCAFDWPKRRSACLGLSSFWRNDHNNQARQVEDSKIARITASVRTEHFKCSSLTLLRGLAAVHRRQRGELCCLPLTRPALEALHGPSGSAESTGPPRTAFATLPSCVLHRCCPNGPLLSRTLQPAGRAKAARPPFLHKTSFRCRRSPLAGCLPPALSQCRPSARALAAATALEAPRPSAGMKPLPLPPPDAV